MSTEERKSLSEPLYRVDIMALGDELAFLGRHRVVLSELVGLL